MDEHTYMREPMPDKMRATCPLCLRGIQVNQYGLMYRHGWKEVGRQKGSYGLGRQWGECPATGDRPLEQTDRDGIKAIKTIEGARDANLLDAKNHRKGREGYDLTIDMSDGYWEAAAKGEQLHDSNVRRAAAAMKEGLEVSSMRSYKVSSRYYHNQHTDMIERKYDVPRGFVGKKNEYGSESPLPSYESLRYAKERFHVLQAEALQSAADAIAASIKHHSATEPNRKAEEKLGSVHLACRPYRSGRNTISAHCGASSYSVRTTEDRKEVTCSRCIKAITKLVVEELAKAEMDKVKDAIVVILNDSDCRMRMKVIKSQLKGRGFNEKLGTKALNQMTEGTVRVPSVLCNDYSTPSLYWVRPQAKA